MLRRLGSHVRDQWAGFLALFLVLTGGVAYAANTIGSADIIDNSVASVDLKNNNARGADVLDGTLGTADLGADSVGPSELSSAGFSSSDIARPSAGSPFSIPGDAIQGFEVSDGALTGADIAESSLGGFDGHDAHRELCDTPEDNTFRDCLSLTFELGHSMEVLAIFGGGGSHGSYGFSNRAYGVCKTKLDGADKITNIEMTTQDGPQGLPTVVDVMALSAGSHTVTLACRENPSDLELEDLGIAVVELGFD